MTFKLESIKVKLLVILLVFGLIPFVFIGILNIRTIKAEIHKGILNRLLFLANTKSEEIFSYFDVIQMRTTDFASDGHITEWVAEMAGADSKELSQQTSEILKEYLIKDKQPLDPNLLDIIVVDTNGKEVVAIHGDGMGIRQPERDYFLAQKKGVSIGELTGDQTFGNRNAFVAVAPLTDKDTQETLGVLVNVFDTKELNKIFVSEIKFSERGNRYLEAIRNSEVYIVDKSRQIIVHPQTLENAANKHFMWKRVDTLPVQRCLDQGEATGGEIYQNYGGEEVIGVSICIPDKNWVILSEMKTSDAFSPLSAIYVRLGFIIILFILTVLLSALVFSRKFTEPLKKMMVMVSNMREGNLNARVDIKTKDEIGHLATAFNEMASKLKESYGSLERKVKEKTRELNKKVVTIQQENAKDEAILESIGEGIIVTDQYGKIIIINQAAQDILNWDPIEVAGKNLSAILNLEEEDASIVTKGQNPIHLALSHVKKIMGTYYFAPMGQPHFPIAITVTPIILEKNIIGAIMVFRDVTKEKEVERMKTEFVSLVSHQLRTPLSGMKWFAEMLLAGDVGAVNEEQREFINNINELNQRMIDLVNALLNIARIESGRLIIEPKPTHLGELVKDVMTALQTKITEKKMNLIVSVHQNLPMISIDPKMIREVYSNLLSNAIKYTPAEGEIMVFISETDEDVITQIHDTGYGIPEKEQDKIFKKFFRASNIASVETEGNGLGLYLVKAIIESSGGRIWFKSKEGEGTTFWFSLPRKGSKARKGEVTLNA
ncbi:MAG: ATP-binding protein [Candidatus Peregrinibacteria bacterium]